MSFEDNPADDRYELDLCIEEIKKLKAENAKLLHFKNEVIGARVMLSSGIILATEEQKKSTLFIQAFKAAKGLQASLDKLEAKDD